MARAMARGRILNGLWLLYINTTMKYWDLSAVPEAQLRQIAGTPSGTCVEKAVKSASFPPSDGLQTPSPGVHTWAVGSQLVDEILSKHVEPTLIQPTFLLDYPVEDLLRDHQDERGRHRLLQLPLQPGRLQQPERGVEVITVEAGRCSWSSPTC